MPGLASQTLQVVVIGFQVVELGTFVHQMFGRFQFGTSEPAIPRWNQPHRAEVAPEGALSRVEPDQLPDSAFIQHLELFVVSLLS